MWFWTVEFNWELMIKVDEEFELLGKGEIPLFRIDCAIHIDFLRSCAFTSFDLFSQLIKIGLKGRHHCQCLEKILHEFDEGGGFILTLLEELRSRSVRC